MDRRRFVKTVGASAGTLALGTNGVLNAASGDVVAPASQSTQGTGSDVTVDVAVVGAGVMGNWTALHLREMGLSVALIAQ